MSDLVVVARFSSKVEAEMAQSLLTDAGVDAFIKADDAGGMVAGMDLSSGGTQLLVRDVDADEALEILEGTVDADDLVDLDEVELDDDDDEE